MILESIEKRYNKETNSGSMGCANLSPFLNIKKDEAILELGSGSGNQALMLAKEVGETGKVIGLDLTEAMVKKAESKNTYENVSFIQGDIHKLPFEDNSFDLILSNCVINHAKNKKQVYTEIYRVLKPGGRFVIGDVMAVERLPEEVSNDPEAIAACYGGAIPKDEYLSFIEEIGYLDIQVQNSRTYPKNGFLLESIILTGRKG